MYVYSGTILRHLESYFPFIANIVHFSFYQSHYFLTFGYFFFLRRCICAQETVSV